LDIASGIENLIPAELRHNLLLVLGPVPRCLGYHPNVPPLAASPLADAAKHHD
jgi:hypothetical protein